MNTTHTSELTEQKESRKANRLLDELDLRDYFAAKALQGHIVASMSALATHYKTNPGAVSPLIAQASYEMADAMLKARNGDD